MNGPFKIYELTREEYTKEFEYLGEDENKEPIFGETTIYTGKRTVILGRSKQELLNLNNIPEWKAKITGEYWANEGHNHNGPNKYDLNRKPITLINYLNNK